MKKIAFFLENEKETVRLANNFGFICKRGVCFFLYGELGVGKTTFVRGFLNGLGYKKHVISPTYTLVNAYKFLSYSVYHFDFYRIKYKEELKFIGIQDLLNEKNIYLIEWPENGYNLLPLPDIKIYFSYKKKGIKAIFNSYSKKGKIMLKKAKYFL